MGTVTAVNTAARQAVEAGEGILKAGADVGA